MLCSLRCLRGEMTTDIILYAVEEPYLGNLAEPVVRSVRVEKESAGHYFINTSGRAFGLKGMVPKDEFSTTPFEAVTRYWAEKLKQVKETQNELNRASICASWARDAWHKMSEEREEKSCG